MTSFSPARHQAHARAWAAPGLTLHDPDQVRAGKTSVDNFGGLGIIGAEAALFCLERGRGPLVLVGAPAALLVRRSTSPPLIDRRIASRNVEAR